MSSNYDPWRTAQRIAAALAPSPTRTMLLAAALAGAAIPSRTLDALGISIPFNWKRLNAFQAAYPIHIEAAEDGASLPKLPAAKHIPILESDDDF